VLDHIILLPNGFSLNTDWRIPSRRLQNDTAKFEAVFCCKNLLYEYISSPQSHPLNVQQIYTSQLPSMYSKWTSSPISHLSII